MISTCFLFLLTYLALTAMPEEVQRTLTILREEEAKARPFDNFFTESINNFVSGARNNELKMETFTELQEGLLRALEVVTRKASLAKVMRFAAESHCRALENSICAFESEMRLVRTHGSLDEEPIPNRSSTTENKIRPFLGLGDEITTSSNLSPLFTMGMEERDHSPKMASSPAEFDMIPCASTAQTTARKNSKGSTIANSSTAAATSPTSSTLPIAQNLLISPHSQSVRTDMSEPLYCYCDQVSFGEMIGCDNPDCPIEWFHYDCVGLEAPPPGKWYCRKCSQSKDNGTESLQSVPRGRKSK